jgi:hypothetical protein
VFLRLRTAKKIDASDGGRDSFRMKRILQIFRDGNKQERYLTLPLSDGAQGNLETVRAMAAIVNHDRAMPDLRNFVLREIVGTTAPFNFAGEIDAIFEYAQKQIKYRKDPVGVERVADLWSTLYALNANGPEGDCGIKSTFFATCCALIGHKPFFVLIKQRENQTHYNHVYNAVLLDGKLRFFDATPEETPAGYEPKSWKRDLYTIF